MRSLFQKKLAIILLAALALGALTVLALSLDQVSFNEAQKFGQREETVAPPVSFADVTDAWATVPLWKQVVLWGLITLMVILVGLLLSPELRKRLFILFIRASFTAFGIYFLLKNYGQQLLGLQNLGNGAGGPGEDGNVQPLPTFEPPQISPLLSYLVSFAFALLWVAVMWGLYQGWKKYNALNTKKPLDEIARIARSSLNDLSSGRDSSDVIIKCYLRMSDVVADKRQLHREIAMTPQEFALRLERAGLPGDAVRRLTRLFEIVRYGDRKSGSKDVNEAVSCLNTILHYCGEAT
jgi:hypothetical protein